MPALWDTVTGRVVSNDYPRLTLILETEFTAFHRAGAPRLYPPEHRDEIDVLDDLVYDTVNNGVYKAGFATSQAAYDDAVRALFATLDDLEARLATRRFLLGAAITEADIRLYTTLVRFDAVYHGHFKCNPRRLVDYPNRWGYARDLYQTPGFGDTTEFDHIKRHYYCTHHQIIPSGIVAMGPLVDWTTPHRRG